MKQLNITNGDAVVSLLVEGGISGEILPWRDVLHEGPVPALPLEELSEVRAEFLAGRGWGTYRLLRDTLKHRDNVIQNYSQYNGLVLWFEHDLYDQLQLAQILAFLANKPNLKAGFVTLVCIDRHEEVAKFRGLGDLSPAHIMPLYMGRKPITAPMLQASRRAWQAFTSPNPLSVEEFLSSDSSSLPFMRAALLRHLQDLPSTFNGLGRTAHHALSAIASGINDPVELLKAHWEQEEAPFIGDWSFWEALKMLALEPYPLITIQGDFVGDIHRGKFRESRLGVTETGLAVLDGHQDAVKIRGIDQWFGGVHLEGKRIPWKWDNKVQSVRLVKQYDR